MNLNKENINKVQDQIDRTKNFANRLGEHAGLFDVSLSAYGPNVNASCTPSEAGLVAIGKSLGRDGWKKEHVVNSENWLKEIDGVEVTLYCVKRFPDEPVFVQLVEWPILLEDGTVVTEN